MPKRTSLIDQLSTRRARARRRLERHRFLRTLGGRGAATLLLGTALSIGGITQMTDSVHFLVQKDLDAVRVVRESGGGEKVLAKIDDGFAANTIFKLAQVLPDSLVTRERALYDDEWLPEPEPETEVAGQPVPHRSVFYTEMRKINEAIHREFFANAVPYGDIIHEKAKKYDVDPLLVAAVIEQESKFRRTARSQVGARGLMQLMPRTGRWMGARDLYDPEQNVDAGVKYIKYLQKRFGGDVKKTIAAYNAGEGNVRRYNGVPPFRETRTYVKKVMGNYDKRTKQLRAYEKDASGGSIAENDGTLTVR